MASTTPTDNKGAPAPGITSVTSKVLNVNVLSPLDFADWYENTHIQEVQATGGISNTQRYESITFTTEHRNQKLSVGILKNKNVDYDFLTIYNMPDLAFRETQTFKSLGGQSRPSDDVLEGIFKPTEFCTRFCETLPSASSSSSGSGQHAAPFIVTMLGPTSTNGPSLSGLQGVRAKREFRVREASRLSGFERTSLKEGERLMVFELEGVECLEQIAKVIEESDVSGLEVGFWMLKRAYDGSERSPKEWKSPQR